VKPQSSGAKKTVWNSGILEQGPILRTSGLLKKRKLMNATLNTQICDRSSVHGYVGMILWCYNRRDVPSDFKTKLVERLGHAAIAK
jgi:hypothetical protein